MDKSISKDKTIKNQQAGRRLSGNQQRELTKEQTKHPERVESTAEEMQESDKRGKKGNTDQSK
ncbi:MAG: hypothetical protein JWN94_905 [Betaproteobacteria bacterium]|nr:hypothetical protein [Betaproteobacteria bacterium]